MAEASAPSSSLTSWGSAASVADSGVPGSASAQRPAFRPAVDRHNAFDVVHAHFGAASLAGFSASSNDGRPARSRNQKAADADGDDQTSCEDAAFALIGQSAF